MSESAREPAAVPSVTSTFLFFNRRPRLLRTEGLSESDFGVLISDLKRKEAQDKEQVRPMRGRKTTAKAWKWTKEHEEAVSVCEAKEGGGRHGSPGAAQRFRRDAHVTNSFEHLDNISQEVGEGALVRLRSGHVAVLVQAAHEVAHLLLEHRNGLPSFL
eukprot:scaffold7761_cov286-Pinguiococcus_pyrenoidosus.AAC.5